MYIQTAHNIIQYVHNKWLGYINNITVDSSSTSVTCTDQQSHCNNIPTLHYSKFAKDHFFYIAYLTNDTPVRGPHKCVLKLLICHVHLALIQY